jgi:HEAT repeat protein
MKRERVLIGLLLVVTIGSALFYWHLRNPSFGGQSLNEWIEEYKEAMDSRDNPGPNHRGADYAVDAVRKMGPAAVSRLVGMMEAKDSRLKLELIDLARKQSMVDVPFDPASSRRSLPVEILCDLGPSASSAVPRLIPLLHDSELGSDAGRVLAAIGASSVRLLVTELTVEDVYTRSLAAQALGWMGEEAAPAVPLLVERLQDTNRTVRSAVIRSLGAIGSPKLEIEKRLASLLHTSDALYAACGLASLGSNCVPILTRALTNADPKVRVAGVAGLQTWRDRVKRWGWATDPRTQRHLQYRHSAMFNLKAVSANMITLKGRTNTFLARTLVENLAERDPQVRELSAAMLAGFPSEVSIIKPALRKVLDDESELVRSAARRALAELETAASGGSGTDAK